jgi:hypothetical protein
MNESKQRYSTTPDRDPNKKETPVMNKKLSTLMKMLVAGLLVLQTADLQAQLIYKTKFSAVEGYTNGWAIGQPTSGTTKWANSDADWAWNALFAPTYSGAMNNGCSWWPTTAQIPDWPGGPWYIVTATNTTAPGGGQMRIASDGNKGTNGGTYFFRMEFPGGPQLTGPITVTWDWQFGMTNQLPADYDLYTNNYNGSLPGFDHGFTFSDYANRMNDGNPNWLYNELCTPFRLSTLQDARHNAIGACDGNGDWNNYGPMYKDGKVLHMKLIAYVTNAPAEYKNSFDGFCQRDGETNWQTAFRVDSYVDPDYQIFVPGSGMRRCAGSVDPTSGVNCLTLWMNGDQYTRWVTVSNIRVVGPDPVAVPTLSIGHDGKVTFTGWLEEADSLAGPWTTVAVQSPYTIPAAAGPKFYRADN